MIHPDHFVLLVNDLSSATKTFRDLGFDAQPGGEHPNTGSHNALIALADGAYLEILAFKDVALAERSFWHEGVRRLRVREGFAAFVLAAENLAGEIERLRTRQINIGMPTPGTRVRPDGQTVAWQTAFVDDKPTGLMPFFIQDETPRELRIAAPREGIGAHARVSQIVVAAQHLDAAHDKYHALLDVDARRVHNIAGDVEGYRFELDWGNVVLGHPTHTGNAMADELSERGEGLYAITLAVDNLGYEWNELNRRGVKLEQDGSGYLIPPEAAHGARIRLA